MGKRELLVITGMSGAGKSSVANALEDGGWYVVDNLPPGLISALFEMTSESVPMIAVVIDVRGGERFDSLERSIQELTSKGIESRILFVDASDDSLVRRFEATKRPHPLQSTDRVLDGIHRERERLQDLRSRADIIVDTSEMNIHQLERRIDQLFDHEGRVDLQMNLISFGYKYGLPVDADLVLDCRFIANPHWDPQLRPLTGLDQAVADRVLGSEGVHEFIVRSADLLQSIVPGFIREGKKFVTIAIGCTGGRHRSVAICNSLAEELRSRSETSGLSLLVQASHRDVRRDS
jgi:RNase adapter protein RapZ